MIQVPGSGSRRVALSMFDELVQHPILGMRFIVRRITQIPSKGWPRLRRPQADDFDRRYGVETFKTVQITATDSPSLSHGVRYSPSPEAAIRWSIENCGMLHEQTTFIDVGSGKGRVLIVAAEYPFRRVMGVEYSAELAAACRDNLERLNIADKCEVVVRDAVDFKFPDENMLIFLYNPFDSTILTRVLRHLALARGQVRIAQLGPGHDVLLESGLTRLVCSGDGPTIYEIVSKRSNPS
jgi:16S rRNA G966 N2-methylase RsmD